MSPKKKPSKATATRTKKVLEVTAPNLSAMADMTIRIEALAPHIQHRFGEKARQQMLDKQQGKKVKKPMRNPEQDFLDSLHVIGPRPKSPADLAKCTFGIPATAFKQAAVRMAKQSGTPMTDARSMFFVHADSFGTGEGLVEIQNERPPTMKEDYVRIQGTTDLRYRGMFDSYTATLRIEYNARMISAESILSWFVDAGKLVGVGEMRPGGRQSSGVFGTWRVVGAEAEVPNLDEAVA